MFAHVNGRIEHYFDLFCVFLYCFSCLVHGELDRTCLEIFDTGGTLLGNCHVTLQVQQLDLV